VDIKNNVLYGNGLYGIYSYDAHGSGVVFDRNLSYGNGSGNYTFSNSGSDYSYTLGTMLTVDPVFANETSSGFDAHLGAGSPAIGAGLDLSALFTTDNSGAALPISGSWDLGAYFHAGADTTPPTVSLTAPASGATVSGSILIAARASDDVGVTGVQLKLDGANLGNAFFTSPPYSGTLDTARIANGPHMFTATAWDAAGNQAAATPIIITANNVTAPPLSVATAVAFAATSGAISGPFITSNGAIYQTAYGSVTSGGQAVYPFTIATAGEYTVSMAVNAPDESANSFFVNIDAEPTDPAMIWDVWPLTIGFDSRTVSWRGNGTTFVNQFTPEVFTLSAGAHQLIVRGREADCQLSSITITVNNVTAPPLSVATAVTFAATSGAISGPFITSNGAIYQTANSSVTSGGQAVYPFTIATAGNYTISMTVNAPNESANSFFVNIDAEPTDPAMIWDIWPITTGFGSETVSWRGNGTTFVNQFTPEVFTLSAGTHQLIVRGREANCQLSSITIAPQ
jgi:hypothetical protein